MRLTLLVAAVAIASATAKRAARPVDDPRACPWDIKICVDGTWVYREPEHKCEFRACWSSYVPTPAPTLGDIIQETNRQRS